jgi:hypothetical protein
VAALQVKGAQAREAPGKHAPCPSHVEAGVAVPLPQRAGAHDVPAAYLRQDGPPLQAPSVPQLAAPWSLHVPDGSAAPAGTGTHRPSVPGCAHETQAPVQAVEQQTPCWQFPEAHSLAWAQVWPVGFWPHDPF